MEVIGSFIEVTEPVEEQIPLATEALTAPTLLAESSCHRQAQFDSCRDNLVFFS
jgi:hypothetical protein